MVDIPILDGCYKPTYNWGAAPCNCSTLFRDRCPGSRLTVLIRGCDAAKRHDEIAEIASKEPELGRTSALAPSC